MNKVYILRTSDEGLGSNTEGAVTNKSVAEQYLNLNLGYYIAVILDDPELLNRIAKESEKNK